jgi:hypothetical protein
LGATTFLPCTDLQFSITCLISHLITSVSCRKTRRQNHIGTRLLSIRMPSVLCTARTMPMERQPEPPLKAQWRWLRNMTATKIQLAQAQTQAVIKDKDQVIHSARQETRYVYCSVKGRYTKTPFFRKYLKPYRMLKVLMKTPSLTCMIS